MQGRFLLYCHPGLPPERTVRYGRVTRDPGFSGMNILFYHHLGKPKFLRV